ncbi:MAG: tyrosine-type recombinase/integrase [Deltaproteobacteria bacterium]|nr:tyrosine-type recombinase/integrase [Deltaproteobacteria bacterium]
MAAVFRRAAHDQHPLTDEPLFPRPNPFRSKMGLLREVFGNEELQRRARVGEVRPYTREELTRVLSTARRRSWADYLVLLLCARCGLRRSEAIGLCWADFRERARTVTIRRKASKPRNAAVRVSHQLKTENSRRTVPVPMDAWHEVELWREHCAFQAARGASPYSRYLQPSRRGPARPLGDYLFPPRRPRNTQAPVLDPDSWAERLRGDLGRAGVDLEGRRHFAHNLRHTYASELLARGADLSQLAKLLGDTLTVAEECYAHLIQSPHLQALADSLSEDIGSRKHCAFSGSTDPWEADALPTELLARRAEGSRRRLSRVAGSSGERKRQSSRSSIRKSSGSSSLGGPSTATWVGGAGDPGEPDSEVATSKTASSSESSGSRISSSALAVRAGCGAGASASCGAVTSAGCDAGASAGCGVGTSAGCSQPSARWAHSTSARLTCWRPQRKASKSALSAMVLIQPGSPRPNQCRAETASVSRIAGAPPACRMRCIR